MLDALTLGEQAALSLGVNARRLVWQIVVGIGLVVGAGVAVAGIVGFVGLMVPHLVRPFTDRRPSSLMVPSLSDSPRTIGAGAAATAHVLPRCAIVLRARLDGEDSGGGSLAQSDFGSGSRGRL